MVRLNIIGWILFWSALALAVIALFVFAIMPSDAEATDRFVVYDFGNGTYVAGYTGMEEWIIWLHYKLEDWFGDDVCEPNY